MNRREVFKSIAGIVAALIGRPTSTSLEIENSLGLCNDMGVKNWFLEGYYFVRQVELKDGIWDIYGRQEFAKPSIVNEKFEVYLPLKPILVEKRIGKKADGSIKEFTTVIIKNQRVFCQNIFHASDRRWVVT